MFFVKKNYIYFILILFLLIILSYVTNITSIPDSIILFQNQQLEIKTIAGVQLEETVPVGAELVETSNSKTQSSENERREEIQIANLQKKQYNLSLFGINLKTITANVLPNTKVVPLGELAGLKLYTKGILVVGVSEIKGYDNKIYKPYEEAGIEQGDTILKINSEEVNTTEDLIACVSKYKGNKMNITYIKNGETVEKTITPVKASANTFKIGLWVRDSGAGVGTITFYSPSTNSYAALGHGIQDVDTQELLEISSGEFVTAQITKVQKGEKDNPGKIEGTIENCKTIGKIYSNTEYGVYGKKASNSEKIDERNSIEVANRNEIKTEKASIICTVENGVKKEYEVEIEKVYANNYKNNKNMIVKITDKELLEKTGGIIQGMSGSPIIQKGKLIGALTHVFVTDPTKGYGVFADTMLEQLT